MIPTQRKDVYEWEEEENNNLPQSLLLANKYTLFLDKVL